MSEEKDAFVEALSAFGLAVTSVTLGLRRGAGEGAASRVAVFARRFGTRGEGHGRAGFESGCCTTMLSHIGRLFGAAGLKKSVMLRLGGILMLLDDNRAELPCPVEVRTYFSEPTTR